MTIDLNRKLPRPAGHHTITPGFSVTGAAKVIDFIQRAFDGKIVGLRTAVGAGPKHVLGSIMSRAGWLIGSAVALETL